MYQKAKGDWEQITIDGKDFLSFYYSVSCGEIYGGWNPGYYLPEKKKSCKKYGQNINKFLFLVNLNEIIVSNEGFFLHIIAK